MTNKSDDIEWGPWFVGLEIEPYNDDGDIAQYMSMPGEASICMSLKPLWERNLLYRVRAKHPHYTPEGQLYYLKQMFPDDKRVQALELPPAVDLAVTKAREIYKQSCETHEWEDIDWGKHDDEGAMKLLIEGIKAGMEMKK